MKSFDPLVQGLLALAIVGLGILIGLAIGILFNGLELGGVVPLFANAIGAAIGAGITLWVAERRSQKASKEGVSNKANCGRCGSSDYFDPR